MRFNKKGDQSLNMIFGLFVLLVISVVAITLFLNTTKNATSGMSNVASQYFSQQSKDNAITKCKQLCDQAQSSNSIDNRIQFCKTAYAVDWNQNGMSTDKVSYGRWTFCEQEIPCVIITTIEDSSKCRITVDDCHNTLVTTKQGYNVRNAYSTLMSDAPKGQCNLPDDISNWMWRSMQNDIQTLEKGQIFINKTTHKPQTCYDSNLYNVVQNYTTYLYPTQDQTNIIKNITNGVAQRPACPPQYHTS